MKLWLKIILILLALLSVWEFDNLYRRGPSAIRKSCFEVSGWKHTTNWEEIDKNYKACVRTAGLEE